MVSKKKEINNIVVEKFKNDDIEKRIEAFNDKLLDYIIAMESKNGIDIRKI